jgi:hypothetical protein
MKAVQPPVFLFAPKPHSHFCSRACKSAVNPYNDPRSHERGYTVTSFRFSARSTMRWQSCA